MALSLASFRAAFPEFDALSDAHCNAALARAEAGADRDVLDASGTYPLGDDVVGLRAAAFLRRQQGKAARGTPEQYSEEADRLARACTTAYRLVP